MNPHRFLSAMKASALLHKGLPPADGFYWMRAPDYFPLPAVVRVEDSEVFEAGHEHPFADPESAFFWGPIASPDELINAERLLVPATCADGSCSDHRNVNGGCTVCGAPCL